MEEKIFFVNKFGEKLVGLKAVPVKKKEKKEAIILVHGFGFYKEEDGMFDDLARILSDKGYFVFRFDFSGCGESEGDFVNTTLTKLVSDLIEILGYVKSQLEVDSSKISVISQSFGSCVTIALHPKVKAMVMLGSFVNIKSVLSNHFGEGFNLKGISEKKRSCNDSHLRVGSDFWKDLENYKLEESIKKIHCPILFIHGEKDQIVPLSEMEILFSNANEPKTKIIIEKVDHGMCPNRQIMYAKLINWLI